MYDRRSPIPRRAANGARTVGRRTLPRTAGIEHTVNPDRRVGERRGGASRRQGSRRRDTPTPFSLLQLETLRHNFANLGAVTCPACGGAFSLGMARRRGEDAVRRVNCLGCGKAAVLTNTRQVRLLVIEQKDVVRDALRGILHGAGHEVVEAADAGVGLLAYQDTPADVVIIDVHASGRMEAAEFIRKIRREYPDARVVGMAGRPSYSTIDPLAVTHGLGAVATIRMPFSPADVLKVIDEVRQ